MAGGPDFPQNFRSVQELLAAFYGGPFISTPVETDYTVTTAAQELGSDQPGIVIGRMLSNTGSTNIAISYSPAVTIATGFLLLPGGTWIDDWYYDGDLLSRELFAISSAAGGTLHMLERTLSGA